MMQKVDEASRRVKECEKSYETLRQSSHAEADALMVKCEELEAELVTLKDFNEDQRSVGRLLLVGNSMPAITNQRSPTNDINKLLLSLQCR